MAKNQAPDLKFIEMRNLIRTANVDIAKKLYYGWVANDLLSFNEFYVLFNVLKGRL